MAEFLIIRGHTIDEKFASIDKILSKFEKRLGTKVIGVMPPVVLLGSVAQAGRDGSIWLANCPVEGQLVGVSILVGAAEKQDCYVVLSITKDLASLKQTIPLTVARNEAVTLLYDVSPGTLIAFTTDPLLLMKSIHIGIVIEVKMKDMSTAEWPIGPSLATSALEEAADASKSP